MTVDLQYLQAAANALFMKLLRTGITTSFVPEVFFRRNMCLLDLSTLTSLVPVESEYADTVRDVRVDDVIGTEDRCGDFTACFYPRHPWMASRWTKVYQLLHSDGIGEPVKLVEYGGYYFVRDGNHRVSVAKHSGIEYLTAEIVRYRIPVRLPCGLNRNNLPLFTEKYAFHRRTGIFDHVEDGLFQVSRAETWKKLEREIYVNSKSWFVRTYGREPENDDEFIALWVGFYKITVEHIRQRSLLLLFPGLCETDVFVEIVEYWNSYREPDSFWIGDIYEKFEHYIRRRRIFLWFRQVFTLLLHGLTSTAEDAKEFFLRATMMTEHVPDFSLPFAGKAFFRLCYRQVFRIYARQIMLEESRQPELDCLCACWNGKFYAPVLERYRKRLYPIPFEKYYLAVSRRYFLKVIRGKAAVDSCLDEFEKRVLKTA